LIFLLVSIFAIQAFFISIPASNILNAILTTTLLDKHNHAIMCWQLFQSILSMRKCGNNIK